MNEETELLKIDNTEANAKEKIAMADALKRLCKNRDFKKVVEKGYLQDEAIRLVQLKACPSQMHPSQQVAIAKSIDAIGELDQYFKQVIATGDTHLKTLIDCELSREEILAEGVE